MVSPSSTDCFEFAGYRLSRRRRTLTDPNGRAVSLTAKAFDTLLYFVEHPGQVVDRSALLEAIWPDSVVEENNLSQAVAALRRALGDGFIVTVPRRGYQFVADVRPIDDTPDAMPRLAQPADPAAREEEDPRQARRRKTYVLSGAGGLIAVAILVAGTGGLGLLSRTDRTDADVAAGVDRQSTPKIAVLPCENLSPDPDDAYFVAGIHEEILNQLTKLSGLRVIARTSVLRYAENRPPISQIGRELDVAAVLECSVRYAGEQILVTAQLIDPETDTQVWSNTYPGDLGDLQGVFAMQADIATSIAEVLDAELSPAEARRLTVLPTASPEAYVAFLKGLQMEPPKGLMHFDRAVELDPQFGLAYAWRGLSHVARAFEAIESPGSTPDLDLHEEVRLATQDANRALAIDADLGLAHLVAAARYLEADVDAASIEPDIERALALSPNHVPVLFFASGWYLSELRRDEARTLLERIAQLDPDAGLAGPMAPLGEFLFLAGALDSTSALQRRHVDREPTSARRRHIVAFNAALRGDADEALQQLAVAEQLLEDFPEDDIYRQGYLPVYAYGRLGRAGDARRMFERFVAPVPEGRLLPMMRVLAHLGIGDVERAYEWAARVERPRVPWPGPALWLVLNPMNDPVLERPRFLDLRRKLGYRDRDGGSAP